MIDRTTRALLFAVAMLAAAARADAAVLVSNATELRAAVEGAAAGDEIVLAAGVYEMTANLTCSAPGAAAAPIMVRAATAGTALIHFESPGTFLVEGFRVTAPYWRFEDLVVEGACVTDSDCEHAFHLSGNADFTVIRGNVVRDFNAQIKSNGVGVSFPDDVLIEGNELYDLNARATDNPVTKLDVVGGRRWIVRGNTIYDYEKNGGDMVSYAAFLKGNSRDGLFERNLVICERDTAGGTRLGLSLGGGGTATPFCEDQDCTMEHRDGTLRNNVILRCPDVGIYLNRAAGSVIQHNTLYDTAGIDVRFSTASADLHNNLLSGQIRNRDGASSTSSGDLAQVPLASFAAWFTDPDAADFGLVDGAAFVDLGVAAPLVGDDFCGTERSDGAPDVGAVEYGAGTCDTTIGGGLYAPEPGAFLLGAAALATLAATSSRRFPSRLRSSSAP